LFDEWTVETETPNSITLISRERVCRTASRTANCSECSFVCHP